MLMFINLCISPVRKTNVSQAKEQSINQSINHRPSNQTKTPICEPLQHHSNNYPPNIALPSHLPPCPKSSSKNHPTTSEPRAPPAASRTTGSEKRGDRISWAPSPAGSSSTPLRNGPRGGRRRPDATWRISATSSKRTSTLVRGMDGWMEGCERR